jgi:hypothetical protein
MMSTRLPDGRMSRPADSRLDEFSSAMLAEHTRAVLARGLTSRLLRFGSQTVLLRCAGAELAEALTAAFSPRLVTGGPPSATIDAWEETAVPVGHLRVPWRKHEIGPRGLVGAAAGGALVAICEGAGTVTLVDVPARAIQYRVPSVAELPWWERAAPLRPALFWALGSDSTHLVHAGAVGDARGGVLLAGAGGSGKTTIALAAANAGMRYVADDYLLINTVGADTAVNLFATAKLDAGHIARFPVFAPQVTRSPDPEPDEKYVLDVPSSCPGALIDELPLRAVAVPRIGAGKTSVRSLTAGAALLALAPSTVMQLPYDGGAILAPLRRLVGRLPCFEVEVGGDVDSLPGAIDEVLDRAIRSVSNTVAA